ncbi:hypothetical protein ACQKRQ_38395 [Paraburkholderia sp. NPDC080076]|uniref:hypothetical protein n=1 Tax=Paraburkholderia sp. NPDC080076 TaxID=3390605 RepID=UPI003D083E6D
MPSIELAGGQIASELPDLGESWLWAHTQAVPVSNNDAALAAELKQYPERNISRLVCPRRLEPYHDYLACVVPAFDQGRARGLGEAPKGDTLSPAWDRAPRDSLVLPVYYHWTFSTGPEGDIESLARRLRTPSAYAGETEFLRKLAAIGIRKVAVDADRLLCDVPTPDQTVFEGAMISLDYTPEETDKHPLFAQNLEAILNSGQALANSGTPKDDRVPTLSPPLYGEFPAKRLTVDSTRIGQHWLEDLNLQPRYRLAAGWGAEVVRRNQDGFMQAAWQQVGDVLAAERAFSLSRLAHDVLKAVEARHLTKLSDVRLLALLAPARARVKIAPDLSLYGRLAGVTLPDELFDGAMRRLTSARRPILRMAQWRERNLGLTPLPAQMTALMNRFANATQQITAIDPNRFVPDGIMGSRSFDAIPLPADPDALVDLAPFIGMPGSRAAGAIAKLQRAAASARRQASRTERTPPQMGDIWHQGILTDTHLLRIAQLRRVAGQPLLGDVRELVTQASRGGAQGVLLTVQQGGQPHAQALKIDRASGTLKTMGSKFTPGARKAIRTLRSSHGHLGSVHAHALHLYGKQAVFTSLPPGALGGAAPVQIRLRGPGQFSPTVPPAEAVPSITLPPAIKSREVLLRYSQAFKDFQNLWTDPQQAEKMVIAPVDFPLPSSITALRARIDPARTVPLRLATTLTLGGHAVGWTSDVGLTNDFIATRMDLALLERLRYVIPVHFDRVMAYPQLMLPLSKKLETLAPDVFLPGVGVLPDDFIMAVKTNPRFVESLMLGANHEMCRKLLWQGFPTDQRGTPMLNFWQRLDGKGDIEPIHKWLERPLGAQPASNEMTVLLIRGQLLERFPTLSVYAYPKGDHDTRPGESEPHEAGQQAEMLAANAKLPILKGHLGKDISYLGFEIRPDDMVNYFFILEEQMTEPRFGFDEPDQEGGDGQGWLNVDWKEVGVNGGVYFGSAQLAHAPPAKGPRWDKPHAATIADALMQRPFRGYYSGEMLKMPRN